TLAHVTSRGSELALRRAIGATGWSVARLVLLEIAIVTAIGAGLALALGAWLLPALLAIAPASTQALGAVTLDWRVAVFAAGCALVSALVAGLVPALNASDATPAVNASGASTSRSTGTRNRRRWRRTLLIAQTALSA